jgi:hypothetical protein
LPFLVALLISGLLFPLWLFIRVQPRTEAPVALARFNRRVGLVAVFSVLAVCAYAFLAAWHTVDGGLWPLVAAIYGGMALFVVLVAGWVARLIAFRRSSRTDADQP